MEQADLTLTKIRDKKDHPVETPNVDLMAKYNVGDKSRLKWGALQSVALRPPRKYSLGVPARRPRYQESF